MAKAGVNKDSVFKVQRTFEAVQKGIKDEVVKGVEEAAQKILDRAKELAPEDTGALKASGKIVKGGAQVSVLAKGRAGGGRGSQVSVQVEFGGDLAPGEAISDTKTLVNGKVNYAAAVHELHPTNAHFLLHAEQELANDFKEIIRNRTANVIRKRGQSFRS